ncbi:NADP-dependent oxidoreductase [Pseudonocardia eucalypti]|uniref:NADP-dependent oxidoreductase n=1 Tax=Pseudonocardia eucalypti TaxID=648755 RepID=A0ABP9Q2B0_9PSEU|nr:NADPH:quinone reductase-like Zn-dependent oxidoreductase [Pseudonocardia eucalypti]
MRAVVVRSFGGPEALELVELPIPAPGPGQVRIRVRAAAVNPVDAFVRSGAATEVGLVPARDQYGLGWDVAGEVDAVGAGEAGAPGRAPDGNTAGTKGFAVGDPVIGLSDRLDLPSAGYAEYLVLDASSVAPAPRGVPFEAAASLPLNALTAAQALDRLGLSAGQTVLVTGAAGAVGGYAVELAREAGLRVVGSASAADEELVRGFGASGFVPREAELGAAARALVPGGVDGVLDAAVVGVRALDAVRGGGAFVSVVLGGAPPALRGIRVSTVYVRADGERLAELAKLVEAGRLTPRVADTFPLDKAPAAHQRLSEGPLRGRLILLP